MLVRYGPVFVCHKPIYIERAEGTEIQASLKPILRCRCGRLAQRRSGRSQVVAVLSVLDWATEVRRRRCAADFERRKTPHYLHPVHATLTDNSDANVH